MKDIVEGLKRWRRRRAVRAIAPALQAREQSRWRAFVSECGPEILRFLERKWNLPPAWDGGNGYPPRPRSTGEVAIMMGADAAKVRDVDWELVDLFREYRRHDPYFWSFLTVPIDGAQDWWDRQYSWLLNPDGSPRPERPLRPPPPKQAAPNDAHEIEDLEELRRHMETTHGVAYAKSRVGESAILLTADHRRQHEEEAEEREFNERFRPR